MKKYYIAEKLKYQHTFVKGLIVMLPLICVTFAAGLTREYFAVDSYNWWYMVLYPGIIGIICGMIGQKEKKKKNYTIWSLPCSMGKIWDAKILAGAVFSGIAMSCVTILTIVIGKLMEDGFHMIFVISPSVEMQLAAGLIIWLTTLWQIPFCILLSQRMGLFLMFIVHMGSCTIIAATISLKPWFAVFPGAITARMMCPVLGILPNGLPAVEGQLTYTSELIEMQNLLVGIPVAVLWFVLLWLGSRRWFERQVTV